ncbi:hypothetical protein KP509_31G061500 [Ceratopteris richardii]|uniref:Ubiquinol oxidase n=1 Tax=Ceratopteris richardii TaxID=49495 RepID=A0A8T2R0F3_CERRI|nr:hypothetical protein KP509_31G061500 [Ceratopteris richardii]
MTSHVHGSSCLINQALNHTSSKEALTSGRCGFSITCTRKRLQLRSIGRVAHHRKTIAVRSVLTGDLEENEREKQTSPKVASGWEKWVVKVERGVNVLLTDSVIFLLDNLYADRHYARFYVLETIARVPYFDYLKVHFAESWNELHHLLVMEALGGDKRWFDRFLAQHIAVAYFFLAALMYTISPRMAYHFSECVERHAYSTYDKFIKQHGAELKKLPAPAVAVEYYTKGDLYMFDEFQTNQVPNSRRPKVDNLYDVFINIRDDEGEHCKTMLACQTPGRLTSPHAITENNGNDVENRALHPAECMGILDCIITSSSSASRAQKQNSLKESGKK